MIVLLTRYIQGPRLTHLPLTGKEGMRNAYEQFSLIFIAIEFGWCEFDDFNLYQANVTFTDFLFLYRRSYGTYHFPLCCHFLIVTIVLLICRIARCRLIRQIM